MRITGRNSYAFFPLLPSGLDRREGKGTECAAVDTLLNCACLCVMYKCVNIHMGETRFEECM